MTLHDPSIGVTYGWDWRVRWFRSRHGLGRLWPGPAGPGAPVRLPYRRKLAAIEHALRVDTPGTEDVLPVPSLSAPISVVTDLRT